MRKGAVAINPPALQPALNHDAPDTGHSRQARTAFRSSSTRNGVSKKITLLLLASLLIGRPCVAVAMASMPYSVLKYPVPWLRLGVQTGIARLKQEPIECRHYDSASIGDRFEPGSEHSLIKADRVSDANEAI